MANRLLFRGNIHNIDAAKAVTMPRWRQLLDQYEEEGGTASGYTRSVWANRCINIRAALLSEIGWDITRPSDDGRDPLPQEHPLVSLLREVNPETNWVDLIRATEADLLLYGVAYWEKIGGNDKLPMFLQRLNPSTMELVADSSGINGFIQRLPTQKPRTFERTEIVYFHTYHPESDFGGIAAADVCAKAIAGEVAANAYLSDFFDNYAIPPILLSTEQVVPQEEANRISSWWQRKFGRKGKRHKAGVIDRGLKAQILGYPLKDLALEEVRMEFRRDICAAFEVPLSLAGAWDSATYQSSPEQRQSLYTETIIPRAEYLAGVINAELVRPYDPDLIFEWRFSDIQALQPDKNQEHERVRRDYNSGIISLEAAVTEMGYRPEQMGDGTFFTVSEPNGGNPPPEARSALNAELRKMRKFYHNGKHKKRRFESDILPETLVAAIEGRVGDAETKDEIDRAFESALRWAGYP